LGTPRDPNAIACARCNGVRCVLRWMGLLALSDGDRLGNALAAANVTAVPSGRVITATSPENARPRLPSKTAMRCARGSLLVWWPRAGQTRYCSGIVTGGEWPARARQVWLAERAVAMLPAHTQPPPRGRWHDG